MDTKVTQINIGKNIHVDTTPKRKKIRGEAATLDQLFLHETAIRPHRIPIRYKRWAVIIFIALTFLLSLTWKLDFLSGSLNGSKLASFFLIDLYTGIEYLAAHKLITFNAILGLGTIAAVYFILGGRTFCSWVCPYNILAELGEIIHVFLVKKGVVKKRKKYKETIRYAFWAVFIVVPLINGVIFFEIANPVDILNRALTYGPTFLLIWVLCLLLFEIFFIRRAWCRYVCPTGTTYGIIGKFSILRVQFDRNACTDCSNCYKVCIDNSLLTHANKKAIQSDNKKAFITGETCTNCGRCIDVCKYNALYYDFRYINKIL